jgi:flagellar assembly protein FliH
LSSKILRGAVFEEDPLLIDNVHLLAYPAEDEYDVTDHLVEALQQEHPDTAPDEIEDVLAEVMDQLRQTSTEEDEAPLLGEEEPAAELVEAEVELEPAASAEVESAAVAAVAQAEAEAAVEQARQTTATLLEDARREAATVLAEADDRAAEIERAAYDKGYEEGVAAGKASGEQQATELITQVTAVVDQATELHDTMLHEAEAEMVALCMEIAQKIVQSELKTNPDVVKNVLASAVKKINGSPRVIIKINPGQIDTVREYWESTFGPGYREKEWTIEADPTVEPGGCILDSKYASIDARIGTQLSELQKTFALLLGDVEDAG